MGTLLLVTESDHLAAILQARVATELGWTTWRTSACADTRPLLLQPPRPQIIVIDLSWPYTPDLEFCDQLLGEQQPLPLVVLAAHPTDPGLTARRSLVTLTKPLDLDTLLSVITFLVRPIPRSPGHPP